MTSSFVISLCLIRSENFPEESVYRSSRAVRTWGDDLLIRIHRDTQKLMRSEILENTENTAILARKSYRE